MKQDNIQNQKILEKIHETNQRKVSSTAYSFYLCHLFGHVIKEIKVVFCHFYRSYNLNYHDF